MTDKDLYKIVIAEDHQIVLDGLIGIFSTSKHFKIVATATNYREAVSQISNLQPDALLTDLNMPGKNGAEMIKELKLQFPYTKIIVLSMYHNKSMIKEMKELGVAGYLLKNTDKEHLLNSLSDILIDGKTVFPVPIKVNNNRAYGYKDSQEFEDCFEKTQQLGKREIEVLSHVASGLTNQEIAETMFVSIETIYSHRKHIKGKLGFKNNSELAAYAMEHKSELPEA